MVVPATPAGAAGGGLSKQAQQAASLDDLRASDAELTTAIATLDREVSEQQGAVNAATQSLDAANQVVDVADTALKDTERKIDGLLGKVRAEAIEAYMRPQDDVMSHMLAADGFSDASRRAAILDEVSGQNFDSLDELRAARGDLDRQKKAAVAAQKLADQRRATEQQKLDQLNAARAEKARLDESLHDRIAGYAAEDAATASPASAPDRASRSGDRSGDDNAATGGLVWPLHGKHQVNSVFGQRWGSFHKGVDLQASVGTPVYAAQSGTVSKAGWESGYGNYTCIDHGSGFSTCYGHQSRIMVKVGQRVSADDQIGVSGNTGTSTGPHLHFEAWSNGAPRDPLCSGSSRQNCLR
jgi:murein DD-endopeptidase MepM/ murein hydrolase activator NlpD